MFIPTKTLLKQSYMFIFNDEHHSQLFYDFASKQSHASVVQHPYMYGRSRDLQRVLVIGVGGKVEVLMLEEALFQKAKELQGVYLPE